MVDSLLKEACFLRCGDVFVLVLVVGWTILCPALCCRHRMVRSSLTLWCRRLDHPNIVNLLGISFRIPDLCLLLEYASLGNVRYRRTEIVALYIHSSVWIENDIKCRNILDAVVARKAPMQYRDTLCLAIGIAHGLAYLHNHSPSIIHRGTNQLTAHQAVNVPAFV